MASLSGISCNRLQTGYAGFLTSLPRIIPEAMARKSRTEIDAGQAAGEIANQGGAGGKTNVQASDVEPATLDDLGIDRRRVADWREIRDAGEETVERAKAKDAANEKRSSSQKGVPKAEKERSASSGGDTSRDHVAESKAKTSVSKAAASGTDRGTVEKCDVATLTGNGGGEIGEYAGAPSRR